MKRLIDHFLGLWKEDKYRMPLLLRGARQVGKTFSVRKLGEKFSDFVEVNLEERTDVHVVFEKNLDPERMIAELSVLLQKPIHPGSTLLFIDEIQVLPRAITALRYFYEKMPNLHVIAAGSLLDFAIEEVGIPVGRVQSLYMFPLSFMEFLIALNHKKIVQSILTHKQDKDISLVVHNKALELLGDYCALGGMPRVIQLWQESKTPLESAKIQASILETYRQDFGKYAKNAQIKYVELVFKHIPMQLGRKFKFSSIEGDYRKRELAPALDLLETAGVAHKVFQSSGQGLPLGGQMDPQDYKVLFLDVALAQILLDFELASWFTNPIPEFINKGSIVEAFVGQEILAYHDPHSKRNLYYWHRETRGSTAEVDYLVQEKNKILPIEVKSGTGSTLRSLRLFLETHPTASHGLRFSTQNFSEYENIRSYPLYAIAKLMIGIHPELNEAIKAMLD
jgi:predicted AAA+ superfamily ATPase